MAFIEFRSTLLMGEGIDRMLRICAYSDDS